MAPGSGFLPGSLLASRSGSVLASAEVQRQSRHKDIATLMGYVRQADVLKDNAAAGIGL